MGAEFIFVVNPVSGAGKGAAIAALLERMLPSHARLGAGRAEVVLTRSIDDDELKEKLERSRAAIAVGGDGTASLLVARMIECENPPALGLIPLGTSNDLARALGISVTADYTREKTLGETLELISCAETENLDVFSVNNKLLFCNYFSIGFDAAVVRDFDALRNSRLAGFLPPGRLTNNALYFLMGLKRAGFRLPLPVEMEIVKDGMIHAFSLNGPCFAIIISNLPVYAGGCRISPEAEKNDGIFEVTIVRNIFEFMRLVLTRFIPFLKSGGGPGRHRAEEAKIRLQSPTPSQIDGEKCSETDVSAPTIEIRLRCRVRVLKTSLP